MLLKKKNTSAQKHLSRKERIRNLKGSFLACRKDAIKGKNLLIVDDLLTTGATLEACAKELKKSGAGNIYGFTVARVPNR